LQVEATAASMVSDGVVRMIEADGVTVTTVTFAQQAERPLGWQVLHPARPPVEWGEAPPVILGGEVVRRVSGPAAAPVPDVPAKGAGGQSTGGRSLAWCAPSSP
jgi:hypothetical protein